MIFLAVPSEKNLTAPGIETHDLIAAHTMNIRSSRVLGVALNFWEKPNMQFPRSIQRSKVNKKSITNFQIFPRGVLLHVALRRQSEGSEHEGPVDSGHRSDLPSSRLSASDIRSLIDFFVLLDKWDNLQSTSKSGETRLSTEDTAA